MVIQNAMKQNTAKIINIAKGFARTAYNDLLKRVQDTTANRQADLTELMLYDIDNYSFVGNEKVLSASQVNQCCYRITKGVGYFTTGDTARTRKPQLAFAMKKRLTIATGGTVNSKNEITQYGAFSDQDFRRCFAYIIKSGHFEIIGKLNDDYDLEDFIVNTNEVNRAIRGKEQWDNLSNRAQKKVRKQDNSKKKPIKITHPTKDTPKTHKVNGETEPVDIPKAKKYWEDVLAFVNYNLEDVCGVSTTIKLNGVDFVEKKATL